jgi:hypothetical protein
MQDSSISQLLIGGSQYGQEAEHASPKVPLKPKDGSGDPSRENTSQSNAPNGYEKRNSVHDNDNGSNDRQLRRGNSRKSLTPRESSQSAEREDGRGMTRSSSRKSLSSQRSFQSESGADERCMLRSPSRKTLSPRRSSKGDERGEGHQTRHSSITNALSPRRHSKGSNVDTAEGAGLIRREGSRSGLALRPSLLTPKICQINHAGDPTHPTSDSTKNPDERPPEKREKARRPILEKSHSMRRPTSDRAVRRLNKSFSSAGLGHRGKSSDDRSHREPKRGSFGSSVESSHRQYHKDVKEEAKSNSPRRDKESDRKSDKKSKKSSRNEKQSSKHRQDSFVRSDTDTEAKRSDRDTSPSTTHSDRYDDSRKTRHNRDRERHHSKPSQDHDSDTESGSERVARSSNRFRRRSSNESDHHERKIERFIASVGDPNDEDFWMKMITKWEECG